jgi:hypothetical protein
MLPEEETRHFNIFSLDHARPGNRTSSANIFQSPGQSSNIRSSGQEIALVICHRFNHRRDPMYNVPPTTKGVLAFEDPKNDYSTHVHTVWPELAHLAAG